MAHGPLKAIEGNRPYLEPFKQDALALHHSGMSALLGWISGKPFGVFRVFCGRSHGSIFTAIVR